MLQKEVKINMQAKTLTLNTPFTSGVGLKGQILKFCRCKYIFYLDPKFTFGIIQIITKACQVFFFDRGFEPHRRHCVVSLSKTHLSLLSTGSTQEDQS